MISSSTAEEDSVVVASSSAHAEYPAVDDTIAKPIAAARARLTIFLIFILGYFRFRGFNAIAFASGDSGIHYGHTLKFSHELSILDINNTKNDVYGYFVRVMPISYINGGLLFIILSIVKPYIVFMWFNVCCLVLSGLLFLVTLFDIYSNRSKNKFPIITSLNNSCI